MIFTADSLRMKERIQERENFFVDTKQKQFGWTTFSKLKSVGGRKIRIKENSDESWVYYHQPETNKTHKVWCHISLSKTNIREHSSSVGKVCWLFHGMQKEQFWRTKCLMGSLLLFYHTPNCLKLTIRIKRPHGNGIILQHENVQPHTVFTTEKIIHIFLILLSSL